MDYRKATIAQLRFIAFEDECESHYKYEAVRELQRRSFDDYFLPDLFHLRKKGLNATEISKRLNYDLEIIRLQLKKHRIYRWKEVVS